MAEDDEAHRKVAVKVSGALGAGLLALAVPFTGWGVAGRGSWQATAAFGFAGGLLVAAVAQGVIWLLMHVRRPLVELPQAESATVPTPPPPPPPPPPEASTLPTREEIDAKVAALSEYKGKLDNLFAVAENADGVVYKGAMTDAQLKAAEDISTYLDLKLYPISRLVAEAGVDMHFTTMRRESQSRAITQATGVLLDMREKLPKPVKVNTPPVLKVLPTHLELLVEKAPADAIRGAWQLVVTDLGVLLKRERLTNMQLVDSLNELSRRNVISADAVDSITGLSQLLHLREGRPSEATPARARDFLRMADAIAW